VTVPQNEVPYVRPGLPMTHLVNPVMRRTNMTALLTVPGRVSGEPHTTPLGKPFEYGGARYVVSGRGETQWVRNLRDAGGGELRIPTAHDAADEPFVAPGFQRVEAAFSSNFKYHGEVGAACAVYYRGELVVDLWGGIRDPETAAPWRSDTLVWPVSSTTKGMAALAIALANSRRLIDYEERVATYWPEFAQAGKGEITVRQLLGHQAGLAVCDEPLTHVVLSDPDALAAILARQRPGWAPGTRSGYHFSTLGMYESELIRRVDPQHRTLGPFFHNEIAEPLGLEFYIGMPASIPAARIAKTIVFGAKEALMASGSWRLNLAAVLPWTLTHRAMANPRIADTYADPQLEMPSGGGGGSVRSIARAYGVLATGGVELGLTKETVNALVAPPVPPSLGTRDLVMRADISWSLGFMRPSRDFRFGTGPRSVGMPGLGGSFGYADLDSKVGYAYAPNKWRLGLFGDPRDRALRNAVDTCIGELVSRQG
jgi:CubicO group peptidase (beta-lactamase class C family)